MAFRGKVALVTGAGSGMGRISARRLAKGGAQVAAVDLNAAGLAETAEGHPGMHVYPCDVTDAEAVLALAQRVEAELGPIDRVTHAAGIMPTAPILEMPTATITKLMRVNYEGTVNVTKATLPGMVERKRGDLILFGSLAGWVLAPHLGAYNASKAAVNAFAEVLIHENAKSGVRILLACPPMTKTPLIEQATKGSNPRSVEIGVEQGRLVDPDIMIDRLEEALERGESIFIPKEGQAKIFWRLRRFAPGLVWWIIEKTESMPKKKTA